MEQDTLGYHPDYGLTDELRMKAIRDAELMRIEEAAEKNNIATSSLYRWRKRVKEITR